MYKRSRIINNNINLKGKFSTFIVYIFIHREFDI